MMRISLVNKNIVSVNKLLHVYHIHQNM